MISRITAVMIQGNDTLVVDSGERTEVWILHDGHPHALVLSGPTGHKKQLEQIVNEIKAEKEDGGT